MRFHSKRRFGMRRRSPTDWLSISSAASGIAANTPQKVQLVDTSASYAISTVDVAARRATAVRIRGSIVGVTTTKGANGNPNLLIMGIIAVPYTAGGAVDVTDFDPSVTINLNKQWLWHHQMLLANFAGGALTNTMGRVEVDVRVKRKLEDEALVLVWTSGPNLVGFNTVGEQYGLSVYLRTLVTRTA